MSHGYETLAYAGLFPIPIYRDWIIRLTFPIVNETHYD